MSFDGDDDYVLIPEDPSLDFTRSSFTFATWVNPHEKRQHIFAHLDSKTTRKGIVLRIYENGIFKFGFYYDDLDTASGAIPFDSWSHIVCTYDYNSDTAKIYIDGGLNVTGNNGPYEGARVDSWIGKGWEGQYWNYGIIDNVMIFDRALSAEEIEQLYQDGLSHKASNPNPADGAVNVDPSTALSWSPGKDALSHDVYLGTGYSDVNDATPDSAEYMGNQEPDSYDPNGLDLETIYYWRIDEVGASNTYKGNVWSFTTWVEPNLVGWWKFDEGSGATASDSSGNGNDGILNGDTSWTAGKVGSYALDFDGDVDYVEIADDDSLTPSSQITLAFWIYNRGGQHAGIWKYASCAADEGSPGNSRAYYTCISENTDKAQLGIFSSVDNFDAIDSVSTVPLNQWHHVAATFNQGEAVVYIDGQLDNSDTLSVSSIMNDAQPLIIGGSWEYCGEDSFQSALNGLADDVRIYDRALSPEEIEQLYQDGLN